MNVMKPLRFAGLAVLLSMVFAMPQTTRAVVLDWDQQTWTAGSLTQSFDIDPNNAGMMSRSRSAATPANFKPVILPFRTISRAD